MIQTKVHKTSNQKITKFIWVTGKLKILFNSIFRIWHSYSYLILKHMEMEENSFSSSEYIFIVILHYKPKKLYISINQTKNFRKILKVLNNEYSFMARESKLSVEAREFSSSCTFFFLHIILYYNTSTAIRCISLGIELHN